MSNPLSPTSLLGKALAARQDADTKDAVLTARVYEQGEQILAAMQTQDPLTVTIGPPRATRSITLQREEDPQAPGYRDGQRVYRVKILANEALIAVLSTSTDTSRRNHRPIDIDRWVALEDLDRILSALVA